MKKLIIILMMVFVASGVNAQNIIADKFAKENKAPIGKRCDKVILYPNKSIQENYKAINDVVSLHREKNYAIYSIKVYGNYNGFIYELWEIPVKVKEIFHDPLNYYIINSIISIYTTSYKKPFNTSPDDYIEVGVNKKIINVPTGRTFKSKDGRVTKEYIKKEVSQNTMYHLLPSSTLHTQIENEVIRELKKIGVGFETDFGYEQYENYGKTYDVVEQMPSFVGGQSALMEYISNSLHYPIVAKENGVQGRVVVSFVVEKDGSLTDVKVTKSVDPSLDKEATRIVKSMPKWIAGKQNGIKDKLSTSTILNDSGAIKRYFLFYYI